MAVVLGAVSIARQAATAVLLGLGLLAAGVAGLVGAPRAGATVIAVADQSPEMFSDPAWAALGIGEARVAAPWNLALGGGDRRAAVWLDRARGAGVDALVSWRPAGGRLPGTGEFTRAFRAFRGRWPEVQEFATWNEPNIPGARTARHPELLVGYWRAMRRICPRCTVLGPELIDFPGAPAWARSFERAAGVRGIGWGLHDYEDANHFRSIGRSVTEQMLRAVGGPIWLTETGGLVSFRRFPYDEARADRATVHILAIAGAGGRRIPRVYLYNWRAAPGTVWDSGLVGPDGLPRPAYWTVAAALGKSAAARAAVAGH